MIRPDLLTSTLCRLEATIQGLEADLAEKSAECEQVTKERDEALVKVSSGSRLDAA